MVTPTEFREIIASRTEGRPLVIRRLTALSHATAHAVNGSARTKSAGVDRGTFNASGTGPEARRVSVLLSDDELEQVQHARMAAFIIDH